MGEDGPPAFFDGIRVPKWKSVGRLKEGKVEADLFAFLTTESNAGFGAVHPKGMPVILSAAEECEAWMAAPAAEALALQRPLPDGALRVMGLKQDGGETLAPIASERLR